MVTPQQYPELAKEPTLRRRVLLTYHEAADRVRDDMGIMERYEARNP